MANNPTKIKDPTEAALTAIQDALAVKEENAAADVTAAPKNMEQEIFAEIRRNAPRNTTADDEEFFADPHRSSRVDEPASRRPAANDDRQSIGQILQAVQRRPSRMSYAAATVFSAAWLVAGVGLAWLYLPQLEAMLSASRSTAPILLALGALFLLPVFFFYALAHTVSRSREPNSHPR